MVTSSVLMVSRLDDVIIEKVDTEKTDMLKSYLDQNDLGNNGGANSNRDKGNCELSHAYNSINKSGCYKKPY